MIFFKSFNLSFNKYLNKYRDKLISDIRIKKKLRKI